MKFTGTEEGEKLACVPARSGKAVRLRSGEALKIINTLGYQVVDTWAFTIDDISEWMSMEHTRAGLGRLFVAKDDLLLSNRRRPLLHLEEDTSPGIHDTLIAACDVYRYEGLGCTRYHDNCADNLYRAMDALGQRIGTCPCPLNLWMNVPLDREGGFQWAKPVSSPGDYVVLRAMMDCIVAVSCCPQDILPIHGKGSKPTSVELMRVAEGQRTNVRHRRR